MDTFPFFDMRFEVMSLTSIGLPRFFIDRVKEECIYALNVGLVKDLQYPLNSLYPNKKVTHKKSKKL